MTDQVCGVVRSGDLDTKSTDMVMRILIDLNRKHGITMVVVTHDIHLRSYADRILHLRDGKVRTWNKSLFYAFAICCVLLLFFSFPLQTMPVA
jgi:energy-coupling factor transporter ATP-binding protein EcfA2